MDGVRKAGHAERLESGLRPPPDFKGSGQGELCGQWQSMVYCPVIKHGGRKERDELHL